MALPMTPIFTQTLGTGGAADVYFNNIPQNYTDLIVSISARAVYQGGADAYLNFQDGTGTTNYSWRKAQSDAGSYNSYGSSNTNTISPWTLKGDITANTFGETIFYIPNYTSSNFKQIISDNVTENNGSASYLTLGANLWRSTSPITQMHFGVYQGFAAGSTFSLYGIIRPGA